MKWLLGVLVLLAGCGHVQDTSQVDSAVDRFHEQLASGDDDAIYKEAGLEYQRSIDPENNRRFLARVRQKMGTPGRATRTAFHSDGTIVNAQYQVSYANGDAQETFVWRVKDGKAILLGFTLNSPLMD